MAKTDGKAAVAAVIAEAAAAAAPAEAEQLDMLMPPTRSTLTAAEIERVETAVKRDRAGRPPGARNVKTQQMVAFLVRTIGDPLERRWRWAMHTPESLSIELGCSKLEALQFLDRLWADLTRYVHAQLAQVDGAGNSVAPRLTMVFPGQVAPANDASGAPQAPWLYLRDVSAETQQNHGLIEASADVSHGDVSHGDT